MIDETWIERTIDRMSPAEKIGQTLFLRVSGNFLSADDERFRSYANLIERFHPGGLEIDDTDVYSAAFLLNRLQARSPLPLLVCCDAQLGMGERVMGATRLTCPIGLGAAASEHVSYLQGKITALEGTAVGIHLCEGPVLDPCDPDGRFREMPEFVSRMGAAFVRGLQDHGMIACPRFFPGCGTEKAPIFERAVFPPFGTAFDAGAMGVMTTPEPEAVADILREEMGFGGVIVTTLAPDTAGCSLPPGEAELRSFIAGADVIIGPSFDAAHETMLRSLETGLLTPERLDASVRRILRVKTWCDLHENRYVDPGELHYRIGTERILTGAREIAESSVTLVRNGGILPLTADHASRTLGIFHTCHASGTEGSTFREELHRRGADVLSLSGDPRLTVLPVDHLERYRLAVCAFDETTAPYEESVLGRLREAGIQTVAIFLGPPDAIPEVPDAGAIILSYADSPAAEAAAVRVLFGEIPFRGTYPPQR